MEPYAYLASIPGKEVRSALIAAFNRWMRVPDDDLDIVKKVVGMLHTASLLSVRPRPSAPARPPMLTLRAPPAGWTTSRTTRTSAGACPVRLLLCLAACSCTDSVRPATVAHKIYGIPQTINSANYVYFLAYQELQRIHPQPGAKVQEMVTGASSLSTLHPDAVSLTDAVARRGAPQPASRARDGPVLARKPHLPDRTRVHRHGQQQFVALSLTLDRPNCGQLTGLRIRRDRWPVPDRHQADDGRLARATASVRSLRVTRRDSKLTTCCLAETMSPSPTSSASSSRSATTMSTCKVPR